MQYITKCGLRSVIFHHNVALSRSLSSSQLRSYLSILNLTEKATAKDVKESFLKLSKVYHPDNRLTGSHEKFVQLREAYDALKDNGAGARSGLGSSNAYKAQPGEANYQQTYRAYREAHDAFYRERQTHYTSDPFRRYPNNNHQHGHNPWSGMNEKADQFTNRGGGPFGKTLTSFTLFSGAFAWVVIFACFITAFDYKTKIDYTLRDLKEYDFTDVKDHQDYIRKIHLLRDRLQYERGLKPDPEHTPSSPNHHSNRGREPSLD